MGVFTRALSIEYRNREPVQKWYNYNPSLNTSANILISEDSALTVLAIYASVRLIAEDVAKLPFHTYKRLKQGKERANDHPTANLLMREPNPEMTPMAFREAMTGQYLIRGNSFAEIERYNSGYAAALWPLRADRISLWRDKNTLELVYVYSLPDGDFAIIPRRNMFHMRGFSGTGWWGYSPIEQAREDIAGMIGMRQWNNSLFANDATPGGVLVHPGELSDTARTNIENSWEDAHRGLTSKHRIAVLEEGVEWKQVGLKPEDVQFVDNQRWGVEQAARLYRLAPTKLSDFSRATFQNIEESNIDHVVSTLDAHFVRWEQQVNKDLMDRNHFAEILRDALLRGRLLDRYRAYAIAINWGFLSPDEVREFENKNPIPAELGDGATFLRPVNMSPQDAEKELLSDDSANEPNNNRDNTGDSDPGRQNRDNGRTRTREQAAMLKQILEAR